jgi:hypothetical protein
VRDRQDREDTKYTRYCLEQCDLLGALKELEAKERAMYELESGKDQCMTVLKLALANLGMWARDQYFPATYAHATWHRLAPFFRLPGQVIREKQTVWVEVRPFNDRQLTRDLQEVCRRIEATQPRLSDGRRLGFTIAGVRYQSIRCSTSPSGVKPCVAHFGPTSDVAALPSSDRSHQARCSGL